MHPSLRNPPGGLSGMDVFTLLAHPPGGNPSSAKKPFLPQPFRHLYPARDRGGDMDIFCKSRHPSKLASPYSIGGDRAPCFCNRHGAQLYRLNENFASSEKFSNISPARWRAPALPPATSQQKRKTLAPQKEKSAPHNSCKFCKASNKQQPAKLCKARINNSQPNFAKPAIKTSQPKISGRLLRRNPFFSLKSFINNPCVPTPWSRIL